MVTLLFSTAIHIKYAEHKIVTFIAMFRETTMFRLSEIYFNQEWFVKIVTGQISWHLPYNWGNSQKTSARRQSDEGAVRPAIVSNGVPFLQMRSVGSQSTSGRVKEGIKERTGWDLILVTTNFKYYNKLIQRQFVDINTKNNFL